MFLKMFSKKKWPFKIERLEFLCSYLDDLLIIYKSTFEEHFSQPITVFNRLRRAVPKVTAEKLFFFAPKIEYLGYMLTKDDVKLI